MTRRLIVNADDLGLSEGVNRGVVEAHLRGIVTSASLMVRQPAAGAASRELERCPALDVGLHVDLGEWYFADGDWRSRYERVDLDDPIAVEAEVRSQVDAFVNLVGRLPTHVDSHQHVHLREPAATVVCGIAAALGVTLRHADSSVRYCGDFYGQTETGDSLPDRIGARRLVAILRSVPEGTTELCCHPAAVADVETSYAGERLVELRSLCDPTVLATVQESGIELIRRGVS